MFSMRKLPQNEKLGSPTTLMARFSSHLVAPRDFGICVSANQFIYLDYLCMRST